VNGRVGQRSWEADDGEKRCKVEVVADDVAISLRWATASVQRNERSEGGGNFAGNQNNQNSQQGGRSFGASGGGQQQPPAYSPEEEPF